MSHVQPHTPEGKMNISEGLKHSTMRSDTALIGKWRMHITQSTILTCSCGNLYIRTRGEGQTTCVGCIRAKERVEEAKLYANQS